MKKFSNLLYCQLTGIGLTSGRVFAADEHGSGCLIESHLPAFLGIAAIFFLLLLSNIFTIYIQRKKLSKALRSQSDEFQKRYKSTSATNISYELSHVHKKYNELLDTIQDGYLEFALNGNIININNTVANIFNCKRDDLIGQHYSKLLSVTKNTDIENAFKTIFKTGQPTQLKNVGVTGKDNITRIIEVSASLMTGDNGKPEGFRSIFRDVSELTKAETNQSLLEERLIRSQQVEAIGTLAGGIAHDFNNLLMAIQGNISILLFKMKKDNTLYEKLVNIETCVHSGAELTKQLLGFTPGKNSCITPININELAAETVETFKNTKKNIEIIEKFNTDLQVIEADRNQIKQVILNLFINSWQTCSGKKLFIETTTNNLNSKSADRLGIRKGQYIQITISNSDNNFSTATSAENIAGIKNNINAGIGIASSSEMIKSYKGLIEFKQLNNDETSYTVYFPTPEKKQVQEFETFFTTKNTGGTVLFVDDEEMIIDVGKPMLEELGYNVLVARGGEEAIKVYEINKGKIDLVILDMIMPQLDVGKVYESLRDIDPKVKTILSSGYNLDNQVDMLMQNGCDGFIQKPFNLKRLASEIKEVLN